MKKYLANKNFIFWGLVTIALMVALIWFMSALLHQQAELDEHEYRQEQCVEVLRCVDLGVDREHCDELFPKCRELEKP